MNKNTRTNNNFGEELINFHNRAKKDLTSKTSVDVVSSISRKENIEFLVTSLNRFPKEHPDANKNVIDAIVNFATEIEETVIAFTKKNTSNPNQVVFGRIPIMTIFCDKLEAVIAELYPESSDGFSMLCEAGLWPFREALMLNGQDIGQKAKNLKQQISSYEIDADKEFDNNSNSTCSREMLETGETMEMLYTAMCFIKTAIPSNTDIHWCQLCFRRANLNSEYCYLHSPELDNTNYKRGKRVFEHLNDETKVIMRRYRLLRVIIDADPKFLVLDAEKSNIGITLGPYLGLDNYLIPDGCDEELFALTLNGNWPDSLSMWIKSIDLQLPLIASALKKTDYDRADSWNAFVKNIFLALQEKRETVTHPFWIMRILILGEAWMHFEQNYKDTRRTDTKERILEMYDAGEKQSVIARNLCVNKQYVSKVLKARATCKN